MVHIQHMFYYFFFAIESTIQTMFIKIFRQATFDWWQDTCSCSFCILPLIPLMQGEKWNISVPSNWVNQKCDAKWCWNCGTLHKKVISAMLWGGASEIVVACAHSVSLGSQLSHYHLDKAEATQCTVLTLFGTVHASKAIMHVPIRHCTVLCAMIMPACRLKPWKTGIS